MVDTSPARAQSLRSMSGVLLRLLLIVSLVFNGVSAPWAMAAMKHDHGHAHGIGAPADATSTEAAHMHHGAMDHHQMPHPDRIADRDVVRPCCDGSTCTCGCVLPPMLVPLSSPLIDAVWSPAPLRAALVLAVTSRASAPFRPPAT